MPVVAKPHVTYGGRFLFTVQRKEDGRIFSVNYTKDKSVTQSAVVAFDTRERANALAYTLAKQVVVEPIVSDSVSFSDLIKYNPSEDEFVLSNLYIEKWDSYHLHAFVTRHKTDLVVIDKHLQPKLYSASVEPSDYIDMYNALFER